MEVLHYTHTIEWVEEGEYEYPRCKACGTSEIVPLYEKCKVSA